MPDFIETADYSYAKEFSGTGSHTFIIPFLAGQFVFTCDKDCTVNWRGNLGDPYNYVASSVLAVPIRTSSITIVLSEAGTAKLIAIG